MSNGEWEILDRKALGDPIIPDIDDCIQHLQREDDQRLDAGTSEDVRETLGFKQDFLDEVQLKDGGELKRH